MQLNKTTKDAIEILVDCAKASDELAKVADISRRIGITQHNTFKIVHLLTRAGFLEAVRGRNGGVRLASPAAQIRLGDVVRELESIETGQAKTTESGPLNEALEAFVSVLDTYSIADMASARKSSKAAMRPQKRRRSQQSSNRAARVRASGRKPAM